MLIWLKISEGTAKNYQKEGHADFKNFRAVFEYARARRESWLVRKMVTDNKAANGCMNALKQEKNGGYTDRPAESGERSLTININGISGGMSSFK